MPQPQQNSIYRRTSFVKETGRLPAPTHEELEIFDRFLREHVDIPAEWAPERPLPWDFPIPRNPPPLAPPTRVAVASPELPNLSSDWWHQDAKLKTVNGTGDMWAGDHIPFFPDHGSCTAGISMKLARLGSGMLHGERPLSHFVYPLLFSIPHPMLTICWPGYQSLDADYNHPQGLRPFTFERLLHLHPNTTLAGLAQQVAEYFFEFSELYGAHCNPCDPRSILLGPGGINFNRLRMVKLYTNGGFWWNLEVAIVDDYVNQF
ncbi:hypothetical protein B0H17DRAFT_1206689 [Mycena rosella]|uniref:Uncharacterized protein n=1 Tax=Mycena rosella TaxID=1033263 RepID=A0AAD7G8Q2_MYCRO|nr:hypothetical protein B0H17DRAFT_1206689 [Mycena rosella]